MSEIAVRDIMSAKIHTVDAETRVSEVTSAMQRLNIGAVMVTRDGRMAGIFSERDLLKRVIGMGTDPAKIPVSAVMTAKFMSVEPEAPVEVAALLMHKRNFRHLPVTENGEVVGMVSVRNVLGALLRR